MNKATIINTHGNIAIVKLDERNFPGILIQGDSIKILLDEIEELRREIQSNNIEEGLEIAVDVEEKIADWITLYKTSLHKNNYEVPFKD